MTEPAVIDLGEDREPADPPRPGLTRSYVRSAACLLLAGLLLTTTAGDAPAPEPWLIQLARWSQPNAVVALAGEDTVLVGGEGEVVAYDAADGRPLWRVPAGAFGWTVAATDRIQLIGFNLPESTDPAGSLPYDDVLAVDRRAGTVLWRNTALVDPVAGVLVVRTGDPVYPSVAVHDPATFTRRWSVPAADVVEADPQGSAVWRFTEGGELAEHDLATGAVRRAVPVSPQPAERVTNLLMARSAVGLWGVRTLPGGDEENFQRWYDRTSLRPTTGADRWIDEVDCGGGLSCAITAAEDVTYLVDRVTGVPVRTWPRGQVVGSTGGALLRGEARVGFAARLDPATGAVISDVRGWEELAAQGELVRFVKREDWRTATTYLAELTAAGPRPVGRVPGLLRRCEAGPHVLTCVTVGGEVVIWRVGEGPG
ncbi:PQQ-binding-like beta-propeller repeat protein [Catellatospora sp. NPDC049609]|uniref:outer membrane protein assembly factor BamB family protein n=1 Tax=Catellatospora sp. NPDC049609 TaxID=3155505 RepID=UPI00343EC9FD